MKSLRSLFAVALIAAAPLAAHAQQEQGLTRAQVNADLVAVEQAGYTPGRPNDIHYPADVQAAEARLHSQNGSFATTGPAQNVYGQQQ
jgi:hypothetical protein